MSIHAGAATRVINPRVGDDLVGQLYRRTAARVRDDLEANVLYLAGNETRVLLVSLDLLGSFSDSTPLDLATAVADALGMNARDIVISCTHTHTGPATPHSHLQDAPDNHGYVATLTRALVECATDAASSARPARVGWALGEARVGFNRRHTWADGTHTMYGDPMRADFCGLEGPDDPSHAVLRVTDAEGKPVALVHNNCCHATALEGGDYVSADFPGEARRLVRDALGSRLPVLYLQGACGDVAPWDSLSGPRYDGERRLAEMGRALADETLRLCESAETRADVLLAHAHEDLTVGVRLPSEDELGRAREIASRGEMAAGRWEYVLAVWGVLELYELYRDHPYDTLPLHAIRIGECAIATNPCELYCQFGLDIKRRSPAGLTMVAELTSHAKGYCPTIPAILGGGYSGAANEWCRMELEAGYRIVERTASMLNRLWWA